MARTTWMAASAGLVLLVLCALGLGSTGSAAASSRGWGSDRAPRASDETSSAAPTRAAVAPAVAAQGPALELAAGSERDVAEVEPTPAPASAGPAVALERAPRVIAAPSHSLRPGDRLVVRTRLTLAQGDLGALSSERDGVGVREVLRHELLVDAVEPGGRVRGRVVNEGGATTPFCAHPHDLPWLAAPRLLGPLARDLRRRRAVTRPVTLEVADRPVTIEVAFSPREGELAFEGRGSHLLAETGVTLAAHLLGRTRLDSTGEGRLDLELRWTASGGPGRDAEARLRLEVRVERAEREEGRS